MQNQEQLREVLLGILRVGLLRIRALGHDGLADRCAIEADHLHNLPAFVQDFRLELLSHYYDVERPAFTKQSPNTQEFEPFWKDLGEIITALKDKQANKGA